MMQSYSVYSQKITIDITSSHARDRTFLTSLAYVRLIIGKVGHRMNYIGSVACV